MPSTAIDLKLIHQEMGETFEEMKRKITTVEDNAIKKEEITKVNAAMDELRKQYDEKISEIKRTAVISAANDARSKLTPEQELQHRAFEKYLRYGTGEDGVARFTPEEKRALYDANDPQGGFLSSVAFENAIIMGAYDMAEILPLCQVGTTSKSLVQVPKMSKPTFAWGRNGIAVSEQDLAAGLEDIEINELTGLYRLAISTIEDSDSDVIGELTGAFAMGIAEMEDDAFVGGDGVQKPEGVIVNTGVQANYVPSGVAAAISDGSNPAWKNIVKLQQKPRKTHSRNGTLAMNRFTESTLRQETGSDGHPIWQMPVTVGRPPTLLGSRIAIAEALPDAAAGAFPIIFGDFMHYKVRYRTGLTVQRLVERYAEYRQIGYLVTKRVGGQATLAEAFAPLKCATS